MIGSYRMSHVETEQEIFWKGCFGNEYSQRNVGAMQIAANLNLFSKIFSHTQNISTLIEFGANIGLNLSAIRQLLPKAELNALEINVDAANTLRDSGLCRNVFNESLLNFNSTQQYNFVLIKGVLIHINPACLPTVYETLYTSSNKYICLAEYYNPTPVAIEYRGHKDKLFKRDFAGELIKQYPDLKLIDYGFIYHGDPMFGMDDITWFLLEKS